jgi:hypothetical protein
VLLLVLAESDSRQNHQGKNQSIISAVPATNGSSKCVEAWWQRFTGEFKYASPVKTSRIS